MAQIITGNIKIISNRYIGAIFLYKSYSKNMVIRKPIRIINSSPSKKSLIAPLREEDFAPLKLQNPHSSEVSPFIEKLEENIVPYEKLQKNDARFTKVLEIIKNRKKREKSGKILLEGKRLINDAIKAGLQMKTLYFSREKDLMDIKFKNPKETEICKVLYQTLKIWSDLTTCPGVMAVFKRPSAEALNILSHSVLPVTIICDNIREPGNLGSVIRNAAAAGCVNILLTKGCVDPWETKVLRSASGGHFRIPVINNIEWSQISNYIPSDSTIFIADNKANIDEINSTSDLINYDEPDESAEEIKYMTLNEHNQPIRVDESFNSQTELENYKNIELPCHLYSSIKYPKKNIVLYIGGETHGLDPRIVKLACEFGGEKIKIPLENEMDSLNSAFALTIILYEIKRQLSQLYISNK